jgi:tetratricopeptide (TPR) repeat protein
MNAASALESDNFYERLGLESSASTDEIRRAYRSLLRQYPPERAPEEFKRIREAYETLGNPGSRAEYDERPDPVIEKWLHTGHQAMKAEDYPLAERYFKQVLLQQPDLSFVRNLLGLCFLYQDEEAKAAAQFERLLSQPDAPAAWFGNAGHAYRRTARYADAEHAFQEACKRATDNPVDYVVGLADVYMDQGETTMAVALLERAIKADGVVDFQDVGYFTKLLELWLREANLSKATQVLQRMKAIATDEDQRRYLAWKLGIICQQLVIAQVFRFVPPVAQLAHELQPKDPDYGALEQVAKLLHRNDFAAVDQLIASHVSFAAGGWLVTLGTRIRQYMEEHRAYAQMEPVASAPTLYTINGVGSVLYGQRDYDARTQSYIATLYFAVLWVPLLPLACYRVISHGNGWRFLGKVPFSKREKRHWLAVGVAAAVFVMWNVANSTPAPSYTPVYYPGPSASAATSPSGTSPLRSVPGSSEGAGVISLQAAPAGAVSDADAWFAAERSRIHSLETQIEALDDQLTPMKDELASLKQKINAIENGYGLYSVSDPEYDRLITRHNVVVQDYNDVLERRRSLYRDYETSLDGFNARVDAHNAARVRP